MKAETGLIVTASGVEGGATVSVRTGPGLTLTTSGFEDGATVVGTGTGLTVTISGFEDGAIVVVTGTGLTLTTSGFEDGASVVGTGTGLTVISSGVEGGATVPVGTRTGLTVTTFGVEAVSGTAIGTGTLLAATVSDVESRISLTIHRAAAAETGTGLRMTGCRLDTALGRVHCGASPFDLGDSGCPWDLRQERHTSGTRHSRVGLMRGVARLRTVGVRGQLFLTGFVRESGIACRHTQRRD